MSNTVPVVAVYTYQQDIGFYECAFDVSMLHTYIIYNIYDRRQNFVPVPFSKDKYEIPFGSVSI